MVPSRKHILIVPFPAFGHVIPLLELAKKVVCHHDVTFALSACMLERIIKQELVSTDDFPLVAIPDGFLLPETDAIHVGGGEAFQALYSKIIEGTRKFFKEVPAADRAVPAHGITRPFDAVIADNFLADPLTVFHDRGIPYYCFNTSHIGMTLSALFMTDDSATLPDSEDGNVAFFEFEMGSSVKPGQAPPPQPPLPLGLKTMMLPIHKTMHLVSGIVVNSVRDLDADFIEMLCLFPVMNGIPTYFVGPLVPAVEKMSDSNSEKQKQVEMWLNKQHDQSVVYVSFGSIAVPPPEQIAELAKALLQLNKPFILSLSAKHHSHLPAEIRSKMSTQFQNGQFLILPWAPQKLILQHPATAVFLSHCGWNSTLESIFSGVPVVAWPMFAEQKINADRLVNIGMAVKVEGTGIKPARIVPAHEIVSALTEVGWRENYRQAARAWTAKVMSRNSSNRTTSENEFHDLMNLFN